MMHCQLSLSVSEGSQIGEVRRQASRLAIDAGLNEDERGKVAIIATELATNLSRYAPGGEILLRSLGDGGAKGFELISIDRGPGMSNPAKCLEDGYSTGGSQGTGLGAIRRLSSQFEFFSGVNQGTIILSRLDSNRTERAGKSASITWGVINKPVPPETACGDTWRLVIEEERFSLMVADGLGHGPLAAEAANKAADVFVRLPGSSSGDLFPKMNASLGGTRGAAVAIARADLKMKNLTYTGVGNISGSLRATDEKNGKGLVSHNGTVGVELRKVQDFNYALPEQALLIMHSDGLQSRWSFEPYPGLMSRHPAVIAAVLYRDFTRGRDDVTVAAVRYSSGGGRSVE